MDNIYFFGGDAVGYKITYFHDNKRSHLRMAILSMLFFAAFILWTFYSWDEGKVFILDKLFPVSAEEAQNAVDVMVRNLKYGGNLGEAISTFVHTVFPGPGEIIY